MVHFLKFLCVRLKEKQKSFSAVKEQRDFERKEKEKLLDQCHTAQKNYRQEKFLYKETKKSFDNFVYTNKELKTNNEDLQNTIIKLNDQLQTNNNIPVVSGDSIAQNKQISILTNKNETLAIEKHNTGLDLVQCGRRFRNVQIQLEKMKTFWIETIGSDVEEDEVKQKNKFNKYKAQSKLVPGFISEIASLKMKLSEAVILCKETKAQNKELKRSLLPACTPIPTHKTMTKHDDDQVDYEADSVSG